MILINFSLGWKVMSFDYLNPSPSYMSRRLELYISDLKLNVCITLLIEKVSL